MAESAAEHEVSAESFQQEVIEASRERVVVVDFWAPWCGPCRMLTPVIERVVGEFPGQVVLAKVNVDENQSLAAQWQIRSIPSVKAFRNGEVVDQFVGFQPEPELRKWVEGLVGLGQK